MIDRNSSLEDVCFAVSTVLDKRGIEAVLTGGSAAAVYVPEVNTSMDADFVLTEKPSRAILIQALGELGFTPSPSAGMFEHPNSEFTIDFPRGPLAVGGSIFGRPPRCYEMNFGSESLCQSIVCAIVSLTSTTGMTIMPLQRPLSLRAHIATRQILSNWRRGHNEKVVQERTFAQSMRNSIAASNRKAAKGYAN